MLEWLKRLFKEHSLAETAPPAVHAGSQPSLKFWSSVTGESLAQGDWLPRCFVPEFHPSFGQGDQNNDVNVALADLIVMTQSCDLENQKVPFVALCPILTLSAFEEINPAFKKKNEWEQVRVGRREGLHLLGSPTSPGDNRQALVVDFRQIFSLPVSYLSHHARTLGSRWRLNSPYLEHFSQAFARFFMRVGLPSSIPRYG